MGIATGAVEAGRAVVASARAAKLPQSAAFSIVFEPLADAPSFTKAYSVFRKDATELAAELGVKLKLTTSTGYQHNMVTGTIAQTPGGTNGLGSAMDGILSLNMPGHQPISRWGAISDLPVGPFGNDSSFRTWEALNTALHGSGPML
ncbi:MAG: hypothetical protein H7287_07320 [Thermoleophilia bacterium]|nr:hypothetical protein [Thermoleophilia bacterium]